jgi:ribonucleoside-triphosphate reductase
MDTVAFLKDLLGPDKEIMLSGKCHDCGEPVEHLAYKEGNTVKCTGPFWHFDDSGNFAKCIGCYDKDPILRNFQKCEVWSRVCGYLRPVSAYNKGKKEEFKMRTNFRTGEEHGQKE